MNLSYILLIGCGITAIAVGSYLVYTFRGEENFDDTPKKSKGRITELIGIRKTVDSETLDSDALKNPFINEEGTYSMICYKLDNDYAGYILLDNMKNYTYISSTCTPIRWSELMEDVNYLKNREWQFITEEAIERVCGMKVGNEY